MISAIAGSGEPSNRHQPVAVLLQVSPLISVIAALLPAVTMSRPAVGRMLKCCYEVIVSKVIDTDIVTQSFDLRQGFFSTSTKDKVKLKFELIFSRASYCSGMGRPAHLERGLAQGAARTAADAKLALGPPTQPVPIALPGIPFGPRRVCTTRMRHYRRGHPGHPGGLRIGKSGP